ncbi:DNA topoisomerase IB [Polluticoccus soli]|uniref:DNA topoisomerase IB n=1 Tax=Polluticoccus soli TaxID=3034150 RepID=UPI0023E14DA1|nr:DNA topoisomerase IB [Flavipsychrobacter sp. JY13-12]
METTTGIKLTKRKLKGLAGDTVKSAEAVNLVYVSDTMPGITRIKKNDVFYYKYNNKQITDKAELLRIKRLVIPPAWENVWICPIEDGHLQVTGTDKLGRKQYKYHPVWNQLRNHTKYSQLQEFGKALPAIREQLQKDLSKPGLPLEKMLATAVSIMQCTCIRIGNAMYEKLYGSFGLTTLKSQHVTIKGSEIKFSFKGKKGIFHDLKLKSKKLANIIRQCLDIPGKELLQYINENGERRSIDSGMVNNYIRQISNGNFTAKDFRTWAGSLHALGAFKEMGIAETATAIKNNIVHALDIVAKQLGNTRAVCKKYYVHPAILDHYTNKTLHKYLSKFRDPECGNETSLTADEQILMKVLEAAPGIVI